MKSEADGEIRADDSSSNIAQSSEPEIDWTDPDVIRQWLDTEAEFSFGPDQQSHRRR